MLACHSEVSVLNLRGVSYRSWVGEPPSHDSSHHQDDMSGVNQGGKVTSRNVLTRIRAEKNSIHVQNAPFEPACGPSSCILGHSRATLPSPCHLICPLLAVAFGWVSHDLVPGNVVHQPLDTCYPYTPHVLECHAVHLAYGMFIVDVPFCMDPGSFFCAQRPPSPLSLCCEGVVQKFSRHCFAQLCPPDVSLPWWSEQTNCRLGWWSWLPFLRPVGAWSCRPRHQTSRGLKSETSVQKTQIICQKNIARNTWTSSGPFNMSKHVKNPFKWSPPTAGCCVW